MPRYIDADALHSMVARALDANEAVAEVNDAVEQEHRVLYWLLEKIEEQTTVSPDEIRGVVHCCECDLWNRWDSAGRECLGNLTCSCAHWTVEDGAVLFTKPNDFCSYGERMVSEDA